MKANGKLNRSAVREMERVLRMRHAELRESMQSLVARRRNGDADRTGEPTARATRTLEDEIQMALMDRQSHQVAQIETALERLARGDYGRCHDCGGFIGLPRLRLLPFAQRCSACQAGAERQAA